MSNSSSSSFILLTTKEAHEDVMSLLEDDYDREVMKALLRGEKVCFGKKVISFGYMYGNGGCLRDMVDVWEDEENYTDDKDEDYFSPYEALDRYTKKLKEKYPREIFTHSM